MSKHTPGPWTYELGDGIWMIGCDEDYNFATVYIEDVTDYDGLQSDKVRAEANARLIASSPDLLSALQEVVRVWEDEENDGQVVPAHILEAQRVIAKATGGAK